MLELSESKSEGGKLSIASWLGQGCPFQLSLFGPGSAWAVLREQTPFGTQSRRL